MRGIRFSRNIWIFNLALFCLLLGSLATSFVWAGCNGGGHVLLAKSVNESILNDKEALQAATSVQRLFRNVAKAVGPAVVSINVVQNIAQNNPYNDLFGDDFFRHFFTPQQPQQRRRSVSAGSGFIIDEKGHILSNLHVVQQASEITVIMPDGKEYKAKLVGSDKHTDIALLKIDAPKNIPYVALGDSDELEVGDWTIAIGNPFNLPGTFTVGVVSAKSRGDAVGAPYQNFIQTDTAINPGNSGGPLVNVKGEVVGINTMIYSRTGGSLGIGFAIPVNTVKSVVAAILKGGKFERGYVGIYPAAIDDKMRTALKLPAETGVIVNSVVENGPAAKAGMKDGDVVLEIDGKKITSVPQLMRIVAEIPAGKSVPFVVQREWKKLTLNIAVVNRPDEEEEDKKEESKQEESKEWLGLRVVPLGQVNPAQLRRLGLTAGEGGVLISGFAQNAPESDLAAGDLIKEINYVAINTMDDFNKFIRTKASEKSFIFKIKRQGQSLFVAVNN